MNATEISRYILESFPGVETDDAMGYSFFYYGAEHKLPFATIAHTGNEYEQISQLDRPGVYRLNIGVSRESFQALFGAARADVSQYDFTVLDRIMPHPDYAPQNYICVLNPSQETWERVKPLLAEAYALARARAERVSKAPTE